MRTSFLLTTIALLAVPARSQNYAVQLWGSDGLGLATNWPNIVQPVGASKSVAPPFVLMSSAALANCMATNSASMEGWNPDSESGEQGFL